MMPKLFPGGNKSGNQAKIPSISGGYQRGGIQQKTASIMETVLIG
jgi:hypothetical protein